MILPTENATSISLASSGHYLVFKEYDEPLINVMTICPTNFYYSPRDYSCEPCPNLTKSFGIQSTQCLLCEDLPYEGSSVMEVQYNMLCAVNLRKSDVMMKLTITFGILISIGLCICNIFFHETCGRFFKPKFSGEAHRMTSSEVENQGRTVDEEVRQMN